LNRTNQSTIIKEAINSYLDKGVTDKQDIYTKVVDELGVPRPTVRRVARDLRTELLQKIQRSCNLTCLKLLLKKTNKFGSFFFLIILFL